MTLGQVFLIKTTAKNILASILVKAFKIFQRVRKLILSERSPRQVMLTARKLIC